jgi:hypothetical protein
VPDCFFGKMLECFERQRCVARNAVVMRTGTMKPVDGNRRFESAMKTGDEYRRLRLTVANLGAHHGHHITELTQQS